MPRPRRARAAAPGTESRAAALAALGAVLEAGTALEDALSASPGYTDLADRDRAFARLLAATTLRRLGEIDHVLTKCLARQGVPRKAQPVRHALRLGVCQLLFLDTPPHAAVDGAVRLVVGVGLGGFRGLVNAVLRRIDRERAVLAKDLDAARLDTPDWLWTSWRAAYGPETARRIAEAHLVEPPLDLSVKGDVEMWAERLGAAVLPTGSLRLAEAGRIETLSGYKEGAWWVQDAAASLPARLLLDALGESASGARIADLCAAPGGKTAQLAAAGAEVVAVDRSAPRLRRLEENMARLGLPVRTVRADLLQWRPDELFDAVLLDAPCSATGTIRRHPDIPHTKTPRDLARLVELQAAFLPAAARLVRPGGLLVYAVCSLQKEEAEDRVAAFLAADERYGRAPVSPESLPGLGPALTREGALRTLPCHLAELGGMDGFYTALLRRRAER